jgi:hypothetical protein
MTRKKNPDKENVAPKDSSKPAEPRATWIDREDAVMLQTMTDEKEKGNSSGAGWKPTVWTAVALALASDKTLNVKGPVKTAKKCQDHWGVVGSHRDNHTGLWTCL